MVAAVVVARTLRTLRTVVVVVVVIQVEEALAQLSPREPSTSVLAGTTSLEGSSESIECTQQSP